MGEMGIQEQTGQRGEERGRTLGKGQMPQGMVKPKRAQAPSTDHRRCEFHQATWRKGRKGTKRLQTPAPPGKTLG